MNKTANLEKIVIASVIALLLGIPTTSAISHNFGIASNLAEASSISATTSPHFWVNSGAYFNSHSARAHTVQGDLPLTDPWRILYNQNNPVDTDNGRHPQNIFRLVTTDNWQNVRQEAYFKINADNLSPSPNRQGHNGLLLMSRYHDGNNLYYAGIRTDGAAVIKKKKNGTYTTLRQVSGIYPGSYNRETNPSLLPKNKWIGLKTEVKNNPNGSVNIKLYLDRNWNNNWQLIAEANDTSNPVTGSAHTGIRTDFMDVTVDNYKIDEI